MSLRTFESLPDAKRSAILHAGIQEFSRNAYAEASTDRITAAAGISKGLLFHYFGSKRAFYLYCLEQALQRLVARTLPPGASSFYGILFAVLDEKFRLCRAYPDEMRLVNLAARDAVRDLMQEKGALFAKYTDITLAASDEVMTRAIASLPLKHPDDPAAGAALRLYVNALIHRYLLMYRETPDAFFENAETVKSELRRDINHILYGICTQENRTPMDEDQEEPSIAPATGRQWQVQAHPPGAGHA